ncbi:hypothetical protein PMI32_04136, partial [Pseudomonas sp. GM60]
MAAYQPTSMLNVRAPSPASQLLQGICVEHK